MGDGFPIDIILFAMIAAFLVFRLRGVLGRRDGHESGHRDPLGARRGRTAPDDKVVQLPDHSGGEHDEEPAAGAAAASPLATGLAQIKAADSRFDLDEVTSGARIAFEMILGAFAEGNAEALRPFLSPEVFGNFSRAIRDRDEADETLQQTLVEVKAVEPVEALMEDRIAHVTLKFVSEQINVTSNAAGDVVDGHPNAVIEVTDFWTFARDTRSGDPNWTLVGTRSLD